MEVELQFSDTKEGPRPGVDQDSRAAGSQHCWCERPIEGCQWKVPASAKRAANLIPD
jgi:hypothetical protein